MRPGRIYLLVITVCIALLCSVSLFLSGLWPADKLTPTSYRNVSAVAPSEPLPVTDEAEPAETMATAEANPGETSALPDSNAENVANAAALLDTMTLEEKIAQLFFVRPESLVGSDPVTHCSDALSQALTQIPVGGILLFDQNIQSRSQVADLFTGLQESAEIPLFLGVDEEGGRVARLGSRPELGTTRFDPMSVYGAQGDEQAVENIGRTIGQDLYNLGFNLDFAPVADVLLNPNNTEIGDRAFSQDPDVTAKMVCAMVTGLKKAHVISVLKHFPGLGAHDGNTHAGFASVSRSLESMEAAELIPFLSGIQAGAEMVMVGHIVNTALTDSPVPSDLSPQVVNDILRKRLSFSGVIITDSQEMSAITDSYGSGEAAVLALQAGCDMILMPKDLTEAIAAVHQAVAEGTITQQELDAHVLRILLCKRNSGIWDGRLTQGA